MVRFWHRAHVVKSISFKIILSVSFSSYHFHSAFVVVGAETGLLLLSGARHVITWSGLSARQTTKGMADGKLGLKVGLRAERKLEKELTLYGKVARGLVTLGSPALVAFLLPAPQGE